MRKGRTPAGFVPKPLRNRSRKNAETSLSEPIRKKGIYAQTMRNRSQKTAETLLLEPTKNAEKRKMPKRCFWNLLKTKKRLPQARQTFAQRKTWKPASHPCSSHAKQQDSCSSRARQVPHRSTTIFCNNFLGALPLTATRGRRISEDDILVFPTKWTRSIYDVFCIYIPNPQETNKLEKA